MAKRKAPQSSALPQPAAGAPDPEASERFDGLMAQEVQKMPEPLRQVGPFDMGATIREKLSLPAGASLKFKTWKLFFLLPPDPDVDHDIEAVIMAGDRKTAEAALDAAILAVEPDKTWSFEEVRFYLHAVQISGFPSTRISLRYIFRQRPAEASADRR